MKRWFVAFSLLVATLAAWAVPTVDQVQQAVQQGHYAQAQAMLEQVLQAKPKSARAHYVYAEVLAHERQFEQARREATRAKELDPAIGFTQRERFIAFERELDQVLAPTPSAKTAPPLVATPMAAAPARPASADPGLPAWVWGAGVAVAAVVLWRLLAARAAAAPAAMAAPYPGSMGQPFGASPPVAPGGNGLLGTGLAAAGGFAAGMLAEKWLDGRHDAPVPPAAPNGLAGGLVPGLFDDADARSADSALTQDPIDFGSSNDSSDGWGSDAGSDDSSGGGDW